MLIEALDWKARAWWRVSSNSCHSFRPVTFWKLMNQRCSWRSTENTSISHSSRSWDAAKSILKAAGQIWVLQTTNCQEKTSWICLHKIRWTSQTSCQTVSRNLQLIGKSLLKASSSQVSSKKRFQWNQKHIRLATLSMQASSSLPWKLHQILLSKTDWERSE